MKPGTNLVTREQAWGSCELMVLAAFRYCLGRQTYIVNACADWLIDVWPILTHQNRGVI